MDLVSIITPCYNSVKYIGQMIESVQRQTYRNWELLITDDCSQDESCELISKYAEQDARIKLFRLGINSGAGVARNKSISEAKGRYIAFLDSDDLWMPEKLEKQLLFMENGRYALTFTSYLTITEKNEVIGIVIPPKKHTLFANKCDDKVGFSTVIYDTTIVPLKYMPLIRKRQDWGLVMSILKECKVSYGMKEPLGYYRKGQESLSKNKISLVKYNIAAYQAALGWSYIRALLFFYFFYLPCYFIKNVGLMYINR